VCSSDLSPRPHAARANAAALASEGVPGPTSRSAAWYCAAGGSGAPGGAAAETIVIANAARIPVTAYVEPVAGLKSNTVRRVDVAARSRAAVAVSSLGGGNEVGVIVETFGGPVAVEHELEPGKDFAVAGCSRRPSDRWYFAAGSTARDAREVLALFNPFYDDAVIDVVFTTDDGVKRPPALRGLVIPARTRLNLVANDHVPRQEHVATFIRSRRGRIVAERTQTFDGSNGRAGFATTIGQHAPATVARFAEGQVADGIAETIAVFNPSDRDADVSVAVDLDGDQSVAPKSVAVPGHAAVTVELEPEVPKGVGHSITVRSDTPVVTEQVITSRPPAVRTGIEIVAPAPAASEQWLLASGRADALRDEWLTIWNASAQPASIRIAVLASGQLLIPEKLQTVTAPAGQRISVRLGDSLQREDTSILLTASAAVIVTRGLYGDGFSLTTGVPFAPTRTPTTRTTRRART